MSEFFSANTIDDLIRVVINEIQKNGVSIEPTKGKAKEKRGVMLELTNPRARLSLTETRGKPFSCLGELCWYLAGSNKLGFISYYIPDYKNYAENGELYGGYGPRIFGNVNNQIENIIDILQRKPSSRQAVIQIFDSNDILENHKDVPCTCSLQFMVRENALDLITYIQSNDIFLGLPHDVFAFTMIQEIIARTLNVNLGNYKHMVGSLHLYERNIKKIKRYLKEGWQPTQSPMPKMPRGNPFESINILLDAEKALRTKGSINENILQNIESYWADLIRLLQVFRHSKDKNYQALNEVSKDLESKIYKPFVAKRMKTPKNIDYKNQF